jgi:hypothetical protein
VEHLIHAQAKDLDHFGIEPVDPPLRECDDQVIDGGAPALDTGRDFGGQRAIAVVVQRLARDGNRRREVRVAG